MRNPNLRDCTRRSRERSGKSANRVFLSLVAASVFGTAVLAQTDAPIQSSARPFGLNIQDKVKVGGSDTKSATFQRNYLSKMRELAMLNLPESKPLSDETIGLRKIDPNKLKIFNDSDVRVYFLGEGAGYRNSFGFNTNGAGVTGGDPKLLFPDASTTVANGPNNGSGGSRSSSAPLLPGDFVDLGRITGGTQLNFFNISNGATGGNTVFSTQHSANQDGMVHAVAYALPDSPYLLIGFEDLWGGGDKDYNDVLFTIDIGLANVAKLSGPEPATPLILGLFLTMTGLVYRRQRRAEASVPK
ncbi:MAG: DUF4114 domain-containing protein [Capsulimonadales bacterium]|nr:DUF4114 domain-containing protein [Capsulimonadales bacterium]